MRSLILAICAIAMFPAPAAAFGHGNLPNPGWSFYSPNPFTTQICAADPCAPTLDPGSAGEVAQMMHGAFSMGQLQECEPNTNCAGQDDTYPIFYARKSDPLYSVTCTHFGGCPFMPQIHVPTGAHGSVDVDHHMAIVDCQDAVAASSSCAEYDFWQATTSPIAGGGTITTSFAGTCKATSFANRGTCLGSATALGVPLQPIALDPRELLAGKISHAIALAVGCPNGSYVWPGRGSDGYGSTCNVPGGPTQGERVWLDLTDAQINALPTYAWVKTIYHGLHHYGGVIVDTTGDFNVPWSFEAVDDATFTLWGQPSQWATFFSMVQTQGDAAFGWGDNASHLALPTTGLSQSNIHIVEQ